MLTVNISLCRQYVQELSLRPEVDILFIEAWHINHGCRTPAHLDRRSCSIMLCFLLNTWQLRHQSSLKVRRELWECGLSRGEQISSLNVLKYRLFTATLIDSQLKAKGVIFAQLASPNRTATILTVFRQVSQTLPLPGKWVVPPPNSLCRLFSMFKTAWSLGSARGTKFTLFGEVNL